MAYTHAIARGVTAAKCSGASYELLLEHGESLWEYWKSEEEVYYVHSALLYFDYSF